MYLFNVYEQLVCVYVHVPCVGLVLAESSSCWDLNLYLLKEQSGLLTIGPSLQPCVQILL